MTNPDAPQSITAAAAQRLRDRLSGLELKRDAGNYVGRHRKDDRCRLTGVTVAFGPVHYCGTYWRRWLP